MAVKKIGVIGSGIVGQVLASGFLKHGYAVTVGTRDPTKLAEWKAREPDGQVGSFADAARFGDLVVLAVAGAAAEEAVILAGLDHLEGKTVIDACNPISGGPSAAGVLPFFTAGGESLLERLQRAAPGARFVKAFSCVGNALFVNPQLPGGPPTMFICGASAEAKQDVTTILDQFGWDVADMGAEEAARAIEPLCILWCIPGFTKNEWTHAFKLLHR